MVESFDGFTQRFGLFASIGHKEYRTFGELVEQDAVEGFRGGIKAAERERIGAAACDAAEEILKRGMTLQVAKQLSDGRVKH